MFSPAGIDHFVRDIGLILSITFVVPLIGAIAGTIAGNAGTLRIWTKTNRTLK